MLADASSLGGTRASLPRRYCTLSLTCPLAPFPLPVGHDDEDVAQQHQLQSLSSRCSRFSRVPPLGNLLVKKSEGPSNSTAHVPLLLLLSPPISRRPANSRNTIKGKHSLPQRCVLYLLFYRSARRHYLFDGIRCSDWCPCVRLNASISPSCARYISSLCVAAWSRGFVWRRSTRFGL